MASVLVKGLGVQNISASQPVDLFTGDDFEIIATYADISEPINVKGAHSLILWISYDKGTSTDMSIKALVGSSEDDCEYEFVIETISASKIEVQGEEIDVEDADIKFVREFVLNKSINFIKFQVKDAADGTGQIDSAKISIGR